MAAATTARPAITAQHLTDALVYLLGPWWAEDEFVDALQRVSRNYHVTKTLTASFGADEEGGPGLLIGLSNGKRFKIRVEEVTPSDVEA